MEGHRTFVESLLQKMEISKTEKSDTEIKNNNGVTALCFAAASGNVEIAKLMVKANPDLPGIKVPVGTTPLCTAAGQADKEMADYLYSLDNFKDWDTEEQIFVLRTCIDSELYDLVKRIVSKHEKLAVIKENSDETPLEVLARKPSAFCKRDEKRWKVAVGSLMKKKEVQVQGTERACDAYELLNFLWDKMIGQQDVEMGQLVQERDKNLLFIAAECGNENFLVELIRQYPDYMYQMNTSKQSIFHVAILQRNVQVFNLIYELKGVRNLITTYIDIDGNNMLHLAAKLAPQEQLNRIPGQALQMQREALWYKEVEKIMQPAYIHMKNNAKQTPYDLFLAQHGTLMKEGERMLKQIAKSCMLVTILIATVVFAAAFTVPGGYNNTGEPILQNKKIFIVFPISEAVATLCSLTSMVMFLSILTSGYTETDFLNSLIFWLVAGILALFVSIVAMMASFCTSLLLYQHGLTTAILLLMFFASVPIMFIVLKYRLLVTMLRCSYRGRWLFRSNNRLFT